MNKLLGAASLCACFLALGCLDNAPKKSEAEPTGKPTGTASGTASGTMQVKDDGWWCPEHGIPEEECLLCLKGEAELKKANDWCPEHEQAKSQCFGCDPKKQEFYALKYKAKFGTEPPPLKK